MWPLLRIGAMFIIAPVFGARFISVRVRVVMAISIAWVVAGLAPVDVAIDPLSLQAFMVAFQQVLIGFSIGFLIQMVFSAFVIGGQTIAMSMGLGFASMVDPQNGVQVPLVSQFYVICVTLLFLALDGHLILVDVLVKSFQWMPIDGSGVTRHGLWTLVHWASVMFVSAVLISLPAVGALMLVNLSFGVMMRAAPQFNIFSVGFPITLSLGFVIMMISLPAVVPQLTDLIDKAIVTSQQLGQ